MEKMFSLSFGTTGDIIIFISTIAWATAAITMRKYLRTLPSGIITFHRFFIASLFFFIYFMIVQEIRLNIYQIFVGIVVAFGTILYYEGLKRLKATHVSGIELTAPFFAALLGFIFLQENVTFIQLSGMMFLLVGMYYLSKKERTIRHLTYRLSASRRLSITIYQVPNSVLEQTPL